MHFQDKLSDLVENLVEILNSSQRRISAPEKPNTGENSVYQLVFHKFAKILVHVFRNFLKFCN